MTAQQEIFARYGLPDAQYQADHCAIWDIGKQFPWFPAKRIFINNDFRGKLEKALTKLEELGLEKEIKTYDGCFNQRKVRGFQNATSLHAWGAAIDLNASLEKMGQKFTGWSEKFLETMKGEGLYWGGNWVHRKDPMHFALYNG